MTILTRERYDFSRLKRNNYRIKLAPTTERSYDRYGHGEDPINRDFTLEEILYIIRSGDLNARR